MYICFQGNICMLQRKYLCITYYIRRLFDHISFEILPTVHGKQIGWFTWHIKTFTMHLFDNLMGNAMRTSLFHFADNMFKCICLTEGRWISINVSLKLVPQSQINIPALVEIMAWCRPGAKPLSQPIMVSFLTHICIFQPQSDEISRPPYFIPNNHEVSACWSCWRIYPPKGEWLNKTKISVFACVYHYFLRFCMCICMCAVSEPKKASVLFR